MPNTNTPGIGIAGKHRRVFDSIESGQYEPVCLRFRNAQGKGAMRTVRKGKNKRRCIRSSTYIEQPCVETSEAFGDA